MYPVPETPSWNRQRSKFKTGYSSVLNLLEREISFLGARDYTLEIDVRPMDLRLDGGLRANARPQGPRVVVSFKSRHGPMRWPCDTFQSYVDNLYAIALTLEKLRAIDRYGVTMKGEQYRGFTAIAATSSLTTRVEAAWTILQRESEMQVVLPRDRAGLNVLYTAAAKRAHPDAGGTDERMAAVNRSRDTILSDLIP